MMSGARHVVFVHGVLGFGTGELGNVTYWGDALTATCPSSLAAPCEAVVGPLSSAHDRACELAAQIKGTVVDYGEEHASEAHHKQFGRDFCGRGLAPDWDEENPVHLVGHSLGAPTIRCLQQLLEEDSWGWGSNHRWVRSISTISGVNNGSTATYLLGADEQSGLVQEVRRSDALFWFFALYATIGKSERLKQRVTYDLKLDQWDIVPQPGDSQEDYLNRVLASDFLKGMDNALYSLTIQAALEYNRHWRTYPDTYYFSYITEKTTNTGLGVWLPTPTMDPWLLIPAAYIGQKSFSNLPLPDADAQDWRPNDGLVPTYSQMFPRISGDHPVGIAFTRDTPTEALEPGCWNYEWEHNVDHLDICILPQANQRAWCQEFYSRLLDRLGTL